MPNGTCMLRYTLFVTDRKNDTVRGDPLFSIPLPSKYTAHTELESIQLCFEIHGQAGNHYNLISDACTSVSARYKQGENDAELNVISNIGVKAQGSNGSCHNIEVDLDRCSAQLDGTSLNTSVAVNGISIMIRRQRVRVSVPNCASSTRLTMWMMCMNRNNEDMLELVVARGDGLEPTAHGLIGAYGTPSDTTCLLSIFIEMEWGYTLKLCVTLFFTCTFSYCSCVCIDSNVPITFLQVNSGTFP